MSDLVGNPEARYSHNEAHISFVGTAKTLAHPSFDFSYVTSTIISQNGLILFSLSLSWAEAVCFCTCTDCICIVNINICDGPSCMFVHKNFNDDLSYQRCDYDLSYQRCDYDLSYERCD